MWLTWPTAIEPVYINLLQGILVELQESSISVQFCKWVPITDETPFINLGLERTGQAPETGVGGAWFVSGVAASLELYIAQNNFLPDFCEQIHGLDEQFDDFVPPIDSNVLVTPVQWWQDADDVPH